MDIKPFIDDTKTTDYEATESRPAIRVMGYNYTDDPDLMGYLPVYVGIAGEKEEFYDDEVDPDGTVGDFKVKYVPQPEIAKALVKSFSERMHSNGMDLPLPIDSGHAAFGGDQKILGFVLDCKEFTGTKYQLFDGAGEAHMNPLPEGSVTVMAKIGWVIAEIDNIKAGKYGYRTSVAFDEKGVFLNLALCQVPAVRALPPVVVKTQDKVIFMNGADVQFKEDIMSEEEKKQPRDIGKALEILKLKTEDPDVTMQLVEKLSSWGISEEGINIIGGISDEDAQIIINQNAEPPPTEGEPPPESQSLLTDEMKEEIVKMGKEAANKLFEERKETLKSEIMAGITTQPEIKRKQAPVIDKHKRDRIKELKAKGMTFEEALKQVGKEG